MIELNIKQTPLIETCTKECAVMCIAVVWLVRTKFFVVMASPGSLCSSIQHCDSDKKQAFSNEIILIYLERDFEKTISQNCTEIPQEAAEVYKT